MYKKVAVALFLLFITNLSAFAEERFNAGVSYDYEKKESEAIIKVKKNLPSLDRGFIDLNYSIDYKAINFLSDDEIKKSEISEVKLIPNSTKGSYEISLGTGQTVGTVDTSTKLGALLKEDPNNKELLFAYSIQLKNENKLKSALLVAQKAIEIDPNFALGHFLKGDILRNMEKFQEAVDEYLYTAQINPYCSDAYYNVAKILELLDNKELALDYYKLAYEINPNDLEIRDIILENYIDL